MREQFQFQFTCKIEAKLSHLRGIKKMDNILIFIRSFFWDYTRRWSIYTPTPKSLVNCPSYLSHFHLRQKIKYVPLYIPCCSVAKTLQWQGKTHAQLHIFAPEIASVGGSKGKSTFGRKCCTSNCTNNLTLEQL